MNAIKKHGDDNFNILVLSCQSFSDLWSNNLLLLDKYWKEHPKVFVSSDGEGLFDLSNFDGLVVSNESMSNRIIKAISFIENDYIFLTFDDYYLKSRF